MSEKGGHLALHVLHFARLLRGAGLAIGTDRAVCAARALDVIDLARRDDVYAALHASFVANRDESPIFEAAFDLYWREPGGRDAAMRALLPRIERPGARPVTPRRVRDAWSRAREPRRGEPGEPAEASRSASEVAVSRSRDFAEMSAEQWLRAKREIARIRIAPHPLATRRLTASPRGHRIDPRAMLRESVRRGSDDLALRWRAPVRRPAPIVVLCDVSGSMERYSEALLRLCHGLVAARPRVEVFLFGTRLSRATRALRERDPDRALERLSHEVSDWSGGTRIAQSLRSFRHDWSRRVGASRATLLLASDGLERGDPLALGKEAARLRRSCRRLVWLNPLLGFPGFEARARGVRALLPHVDALRPVHDLESLSRLAAALDESVARRPVVESIT